MRDRVPTSALSVLTKRIRRYTGATLTAIILTGSACSEVSRSEGSVAWRAIRDTVGDTVVVRTELGSVWGQDAHLVEEVRIGQLEGPEEYTFGAVNGLAVAPDGAIYVVDRHGPALRKYAADGTYLRTFGGKGKGPGEYANTDGGVAVLPDGRVLLRDPGNGRITVYSSEGEYLDAWRISGGMDTNSPLIVDTAGRSYHMGFEFDEATFTSWFVRFAPDGTVLDTLPYPDLGYEAPQLTAVDLFEPDGTFLGVVRAPERFHMNPQPVARGDHVWATVSDEFDVPYVVRYRIAYTAAPKRS